MSEFKLIHGSCVEQNVDAVVNAVKLLIDEDVLAGEELAKTAIFIDPKDRSTPETEAGIEKFCELLKQEV